MATDDLKVFSEACERFRQPLAIRGSTAYMLSREQNLESIVQAVPPLADLDLIVRDNDPAQSMHRVGEVLGHYRAYVPSSRFIHVDVFYEKLPVRRDSPLGNVVIRNMPEISITQEDGWKATFKNSNENLKVEVTLRARETLFRDLLYLLRLSQRHKGLDDAIAQVTELLIRENPGELGLVTQAKDRGRELRRIDKALVKRVLFRESEKPKTESVPLTMHFARRSPHWLNRFMTHLNDLSQKIIRSENDWGEKVAIVYLVDGRVVKFQEALPLSDEEERVRWSKLLPAEERMEKELDPEKMQQKLTPSLMVPLPSPDDPGCCIYRDFSKGIGELAFRDPGGNPLLDIAMMEGREKYYPVHAQAASGLGVTSFRVDPGYMGILNDDSMATVSVVGVRE